MSSAEPVSDTALGVTNPDASRTFFGVAWSANPVSDTIFHR